MKDYWQDVSQSFRKYLRGWNVNEYSDASIRKDNLIRSKHRGN